MPDLAVPVGYDTYGHDNSPWTQNAAGFKASTSGTAAGTIVNPAGQDPTGTTNINPPFCVSDSVGQFQVTPKGTQTTTGNLRTIYFQNPYPMVRPVLAVMSVATSDAAAGGTLVITMTKTSLTLKVGTKLASSGAVTNVAYRIL
jgi:hypothetical protein